MGIMKRTEKKELQTKGFAKFLHKTFMFVTYPFRKPLIVLLILLVMFLAPTFRGVKPAEVHLWYWEKVKTVWSEISEAFSKKTQELLPEDISIPNLGRTAKPEKAIEQVADTPENTPQAIRRKMFEKAKADQDSIQKVDILEKEEVVAAPEKTDDTSLNQPERQAAPTILNAPETPAVPTIVEKKKLPLVYLSRSEEISGKAIVNNANEIELRGKPVFLYGIYVDPRTQKGIEAKNYLKSIVDGNEVSCIINAYTYQGIATGKCSANGVYINKALVDGGYSKNVALDE